MAWEHAETEVPQDDAVGTVLGGRYVLEELLGTGAMGRVFKARHAKINRSYAVKLLHQHLMTEPKVVRRFQQEAELAGTLSHPNVVAVIDAGESPIGHYLVMELAEGVTLTHVMASAPLERGYAISLLEQICDGLSHAHDQGQIHRDLKPDNIVVGDDGVVRIVDFGIATMKDEYVGPDKRERLTTEGLVLGTPQYMCPVLATGRPYDHRVDLFALGVIAYEMFTGVLPYEGDGADVVRANVVRATPAFSQRMPTVQTDPLLEAFTHKLMAKDPHDRPSSALAARKLLGMIERDPVAAGLALGVDVPEPTTDLPVAPPAMTTEELPIRKTRRRWPWLVAAALLLGCTIGYVATQRGETHTTTVVIVQPPTIVTTPTPPPAPAPAVGVVDVQADPLPPAARPRPRAHSGSGGDAHRPTVAAVTGTTSTQVTDLYVAVGQRLRAHPDDNLWARFRRIRIQDALTSQEARTDAIRTLGEIDRSLP